MNKINMNTLRRIQDKLSDIRINKKGTIGTEPISKNGKRYTEVKLGRLGHFDIPRFKKHTNMKKTGMDMLKNAYKPKKKYKKHKGNPTLPQENEMMAMAYKKKGSKKKKVMCKKHSKMHVC